MRRSEYRVYYPIILHGDSHQNHRYRRQDKDGEERTEFTNLSSPWKIEEEQADKGDRPYEAKRVKVKHSILWNPYAVIIEIVHMCKKEVKYRAEKLADAVYYRLQEQRPKKHLENHNKSFFVFFHHFTSFQFPWGGWMTMLLRYNYILTERVKKSIVFWFLKKLKNQSHLCRAGLILCLCLFIFRSCYIWGVEHFVRLVAAGLTEELGVQALYSLALMRLAQVILLLQVLKRGFEVYR